jgi:hypothetical protein
MSWTTPRELRAQLARLWDRGVLARPLASKDATFPLRLMLKGPSSAELTDRFEAVRAWAADLAAVPHMRIEWREVRHRVQGVQRLPAQAWVDSLDAALAVLGKRREGERLAQAVARTRAECPALLPWLARKPLQAIELADAWPQLLAVVRWLAAHPRSGIYLRQVDVAGVHSKFIEAHRTVLSELLDLVLPADAIVEGSTGVTQFAARYGFRDKPVRIRFRLLDAATQSIPGLACPDITLDAESFARMQCEVARVFVTENETNFLAFPEVPNALVVFGAGYGWEALAHARWLARCEMRYWGDIDTHGFAILDQLRGHFPHVASFLMDRETLHAHRQYWGEEPLQVRHELSRLDHEERTLYDALRENRIRDKLRLEQERVGFRWVTTRLREIG